MTFLSAGHNLSSDGRHLPQHTQLFITRSASFLPGLIMAIVSSHVVAHQLCYHRQQQQQQELAGWQLTARPLCLVMVSQNGAGCCTLSLALCVCACVYMCVCVCVCVWACVLGELYFAVCLRVCFSRYRATVVTFMCSSGLCVVRNRRVFVCMWCVCVCVCLCASVRAGHRLPD